MGINLPLSSKPAIIFLLFACILSADCQMQYSSEDTLRASPDTVLTESVSSSENTLPENALVVTPARKSYKDGEMILKIPKLEIDVPVWDGTSDENLKKGACLYEYAQMPSESFGNVSIAAHRNGIKNGKIVKLLFYAVDTLSTGDTLILEYQDKQFIYSYSNTYIVQPDDWSPILTCGYSCVTLTSCNPIGISTGRIIVRFTLDEIREIE